MATKTKKLRIVLAKLVDDVEVISAGARDLGEAPTLAAIKRAVAVVWKLSGTETDLEKARKFAAIEGYTVLVYKTSERNPLERARAEISAAG